jgi:hypothetical protein
MVGRGSLVAAFLATLAHPRWWLLALAGFLIRGGIALLLIPIVVPPTIAGVAAMLAPTVVVLASGGSFPIVPALLVATAILGWVLVAGGLGAWFDAAIVGDTRTDEDLDLGVVTGSPAGNPADGPLPAGLGTIRLGPHVATAVVFVVAAIDVIEVAYREATSPGAPTVPFVIRILGETLVPVGVLVATWVVAEAVGGLGLRLVLAARHPDAAPGVGAAILNGCRSLLSPRAISTLLVTDLVTLVVAVPGALAAARAWYQLRRFFTDGADAAFLGLGLFIFVSVVLGWLALLAVALAWRSAVWTLRTTTVTQPLLGASEASR